MEALCCSFLESKIGENKYCQVQIAYNYNSKQIDWKEQDKECYNIWGYEQLPQGTLPQQPLQQGMTQPQSQQLPGQLPAAQPGVNPLDPILTEVKNLVMANGQTLEQLINSRHPAAQGMIEWSITTAVEPNNYSILVKVPPENPQSFKISHRFNYNTVTKVLSPTISDSKNLLDSITPQTVR